MKSRNRLPLVTVLMPVYNTDQYLDEAIKSILGQSFKDFEFLIINDGSTDRSEAIVRKYEDQRIRFINNRKHSGLVSILNQGLKIARGKYLVRMDSDDISLSNRIQKQVKFMELHPEIDISGTWFEVFGPGSQRRVYSRPLDQATCKASLLFTDPVCHGCSIMKMKTIQKYNLEFNPKFKHLEDFEFFSRVADRIKFSNIGEVLYLYRYHNNRTGSIYKNEQDRQMKRVLQIYLRKLGVASPKTGIEIHWQILTGHYYPNQVFLVKTRKWLLSLIAANTKSQIYDSVEFRKIIDERWAIVYRAYRAQVLLASRLGWAIKLKRKVSRAISFIIILVKRTGFIGHKPIFRSKPGGLTIPNLEVQIA